MVFRSGAVFAFYIEQENKHGIVQILRWGKAGYHVRVFYKLIDHLERKAIDAVVETTDFYYIKDFYPLDLLNGKKVGRFAIPEFVSVPKYTRYSERKQNGELWWYVMGDSGNVKIYKTFDEKLIPLSPGAAWGIQYIKKRWIEGFTLEHWHELEEKWYREYLKVYEPCKLLKARKENIIKCFVEKNIPQAALEKLNALLSDFEKQLSANKKDVLQAEQMVKALTLALNSWNSLYTVIETEESEMILEYVSDLLKNGDCAEVLGVMDAFREW